MTLWDRIQIFLQENEHGGEFAESYDDFSILNEWICAQSDLIRLGFQAKLCSTYEIDEDTNQTIYTFSLEITK